MDALFGLACPLILGVITAVLAGRKGYNPAFWFLAAGIIGLLILAFLPFVNDKSDLPRAARAEKKKAGDMIGGVISVIVLLLIVVQLLVR